MTARKHKCSLNANLRQIIGPVFKTLSFKNCAEQVQANTKFRETWTIFAFPTHKTHDCFSKFSTGDANAVVKPVSSRQKFDTKEWQIKLWCHTRLNEPISWNLIYVLCWGDVKLVKQSFERKESVEYFCWLKLEAVFKNSFELLPLNFSHWLDRFIERNIFTDQQGCNGYVLSFVILPT